MRPHQRAGYSPSCPAPCRSPNSCASRRHPAAGTFAAGHRGHGTGDGRRHGGAESGHGGGSPDIPRASCFGYRAARLRTPRHGRRRAAIGVRRREPATAPTMVIHVLACGPGGNCKEGLREIDASSDLSLVRGPPLTPGPWACFSP
jgi:hypothetical protein